MYLGLSPQPIDINSGLRRSIVGWLPNMRWSRDWHRCGGNSRHMCHFNWGTDSMLWIFLESHFPLFSLFSPSVAIPEYLSWQILTPRLHRPSVAAVPSLVVSGIPSIEMRVALKEKEQPGEHVEFYSIYLSIYLFIYLKHGEFENWDEMG